MLRPVLPLVVCTLVAFACSNGTAQEPPAWGGLKGRIVWNGEKLPEVKAIETNKPGLKAAPVSEEWVVHPKNRGIRWVMVWLVAEKNRQLPIHPGLRALKEKSVPLDMVNYAFYPHNLILREGQELEVRNLIDNNGCFACNGHPVNNPHQSVGLPPQKSATIKGLRADRFPVVASDNCWGWMRAYIRVLDHPYFAVTDADGSFEIKQAPAGEWTMMIWHDTGWIDGAKGKDGRKIAVKGNTTTDLGNIQWIVPVTVPMPAESSKSNGR